MANRELQIILTMRDELTKKLDGVERALKDSKKAAETTSSSFNKLAGTFAAVLSIGAITQFGRASVQAASDQQVANEKLANALGNVKGARDGEFEALQRQAAALQKVTRFADEQITNSQALLATFQLTGSTIEKLTPRILDMVEANAQLGGETVDLHGATLAIGKAMTNGIGVLSRYGVAMTQAQRDAFELADQQGKLAVLTQVLDDNFAGTAETVGRTFAGRVAIAKNAIGELQENIGFALIPSLEQLLGIVTDGSNAIAENSNQVNQWGQNIYRATNFVIGMGKAVKLGIETVAAFGDVLLAIMDAKKNALAGLDKILTGDFVGAWDAIKEATDTGWSDVLQTSKGWAEQLGDTWDSIGESANRSINLEGYKPIQAASISAYRSMKSGAGDATSGLQKVEDHVSDLHKAYKEFGRGVDDALFDARQSHKATLQGLNEGIRSARARIRELRSELSSQQGSNTKTVAEAVVANEQRIAEIQTELAKGVSVERRAELQKELTERQNAATQNAAFIQSIEAAVNEARRVAGLSDLARAVEEFNQRQALAQSEYNQKVALLEQEIKQTKKKVDQENELYEKRRNFIKDTMATVTGVYEGSLAANFKLTKDAVARELELYKELARAISAARSGNSAEVNRAIKSVKVNDAVIAPGGKVISTHPDDYIIATKTPGSLGGGSVVVNINGGTYLSENVAQEIGDQIIAKYLMTQKLS